MFRPGCRLFRPGIALFFLLAAAALAPLPGSAEDIAEILVSGVRGSRIASDASASAGTITETQIAEYPILRPGEILQLVPGLVVVQHAAAGKANQYYLRGFELDHGDMFLTEVDGVPINMVTHAHGPGYTDLNWLIPELTENIDYAKGPYAADKGDFANAGSADLHMVSSVPRPFLKEEIGGDGYARLLGAVSPAVGPGKLLIGGEYMHDDGPWMVANNYRKLNGLIRYSQEDASQEFSVTLQGYHGIWRGGDQVPLRGIEDGLYARYAVLNPDTGGTSSRYSLYGDWHEADGQGKTEAVFYAAHYTLDLFSDFTYFLDPNGDEIRENDRRWTTGGHVDRTVDSHYLGLDAKDRFGFEARRDDIRLFLNHVIHNRLHYSVRADQVAQSTLSPWWENQSVWTDWFSTTFGARADVLVFSDGNTLAANSGSGVAWKPSPKLGMKFGPWAKTDFYVQAGYGISGQDIRGVTTTVAPGPMEFGGGGPVAQTAALTRNRGAEIGAHTKAVPGLDSTVSVWALESDNEFVFNGDTGAVDGSGRPGRRVGIEWNNRWQPTDWLDVTGDVALSRAHYTDPNNPVGNLIPESVGWMSSGEATLHDIGRMPDTTATLGWRYLGPRYLIEDGNVRSKPSLLFNLRLQYELTPDITLGAQVLNLLDTRYFDAQYYYASRLKNELATVGQGGQNGYMVHPGEPREFRIGVTERF